jgi:ferredoxin
VREKNALAFIQRGFVTKIGPNFEDPLQDTGCDACGMCTDVCPTAAITLNTGKECGPWVWQTQETSCSACDRGCGLSVHTAEGKVVKVQSINGDPVNGAVICAEGRFSYQLWDDATEQQDPAAARQALKNSASSAVVLSPRLTVEQTYIAATMARGVNASLHYLAGTAEESGGNGKISGEANLALLHKLGATPLNGSSADCIVSVGAGVTKELAGKAVLISLATPGSTTTADYQLLLPDPLNISGSILNRDGALALLRGALPDNTDPAGLSTLAALAGDIRLSDLTTARRSLASEVSELAALNNLNGDDGRLAETSMAPELGGVAPDGREQAFRDHLTSLGL